MKNYKTDFCMSIKFRNNKFLKDVKVLQNIFLAILNIMQFLKT